MVEDARLAALATAGYAVVCVRHHARPRPAELRVFDHANAHERPWLRVPQQLGTPWTLPVSAAVLAASGRRRQALAAVLALPAEKALEVATKKLLGRPRPVAVTPTTLRDDAPDEGPSLPSGHAAIAAAAAYLLTRCAGSPALGAAAASAAGLTSWARVQQGAHWPSDVLAGTLLGVAIAAGLQAGCERLP